ncbi:PTS sugar transporter subunit IIA [Rhodopseudomonas palustris]|nr:PTS sugar transporter subunit IIA [Rhodopseudomonas palustris]
MVIGDILLPAHVVVGLRCSDRGQLISELSSIASKAVDRPQVLLSERLLERERLGSTGVGDGVAIPHARFDELARPFGLFARLQRPIDFDAIDSKPVDLVFLLLLPAASSREQLTLLASVARHLRQQVIARELRAAVDASAAFQVLTRA